MRIRALLLAGLLVMTGCNVVKLDKKTKTTSENSGVTAGQTAGQTVPVTTSSSKPSAGKKIKKIAKANIPGQIASLKGQDESGQTVDIKELAAGKPTAVVFWASWCPDCKGSLPRLAKWAKSFPGQLYGMNVVDGKREQKDSGFSYLTKENLSINNIAVDMREAMNAFGIVSIPHLIVFDKNGKTLMDTTKINPEELTKMNDLVKEP